MMLIPAVIIRTQLVLKEFDSKDYCLKQLPLLGTTFKYRYIGTIYSITSYNNSSLQYKRFYGTTNWQARLFSDPIEVYEPTDQKAKLQTVENNRISIKYYAYTLPSFYNSTNYIFAIRKDRVVSEAGLWIDILSFLNICNIYFILFLFVFPSIIDILYNKFMLYHEIRRRKGTFISVYEDKRDALLNRQEHKASVPIESVFFCLQFAFYLSL